MELWDEVDQWLAERLVAPDAALEAAGEPAAVAPNQGKLLHLLARIQTVGAKGWDGFVLAIVD